MRFAMALLALGCAVRLGARPLSSDELFDSSNRGKTVTAGGVVRKAVLDDEGRVSLDVFRNVSSFRVVIDDSAMLFPDDLEDAEIEVQGRLEAEHDEGGAFVGVAVHAIDAVDVSVAVPPPPDPFQLELTHPTNLLAIGSSTVLHRIRVGGIVVFADRLERSFMLRLPSGDVYSVSPRARSADLPVPGDEVEVCGFLAHGGLLPIFEEALVRPVSSGNPVPAPVHEDLSSIAAWGGAFGRMVTTEGTVDDVNLRDDRVELVLVDGDALLTTVLPRALVADVPRAWQVGARLSVTGNISVLHRHGLLLLDSDVAPEILLKIQDADGVRVLRRAPFWTTGRLWILIGVLLVLAAVLLAAVRWHERTRATAIQRERLRFSHDLHDNLQQLLAATMFRLDAAQSFFDADPGAAREQLSWAKKAVANTQAGLRQVLWDLQQESEGPSSLAGLIRYAMEKMPHWQGRVSFASAGSEPGDARRFGGHFLMVMQEAVGNAFLHGRADAVCIRLVFRPGLVRLIVSDDGDGFVPDSVPGVTEGHIGLTSMRRRAEELGGRLSIKSERGKGTWVIVEVKV